MSDAGSSVSRSHRQKPHHNLQVSRSLDRYGGRGGEDNKENSFKARIHVTSPDRGSPAVGVSGGGGGGVNRKPYKTTINTANDNIIQYDGGYNHPSRGQQQRQLYQKNQASFFISKLC